MLTPQRVLTFDIGIRNLAWCLLEKGVESGPGTESGPWKILGWENYDLLAGSPSEEAKKKEAVLCGTCKKKGTHWLSLAGTREIRCKKHCPPDLPPLADLSGNLLKGIPGLPILRELVGPSSQFKKLKKSDLVDQLRKKYSLPVEKIKATKAIQTDLGTIHTALQTFVAARSDLFRTAGKILLENQPAFKNPTMKSIQILLFATIRASVLPGIASIGFVNAGKKTKGALSVAIGDKGYTDRKKASEARVQAWFQKEMVTDKLTWSEFLKGNHKKNDLCDCLCMCLDALASK